LFYFLSAAARGVTQVYSIK